MSDENKNNTSHQSGRFSRSLLVAALIGGLFMGATFFWDRWNQNRPDPAAVEARWEQRLRETSRTSTADELRAMAGVAYKQLPDSAMPSYFLAMAEFRAGHLPAALGYMNEAIQKAGSDRFGQYAQTLENLKNASPLPFKEGAPQ